MEKITMLVDDGSNTGAGGGGMERTEVRGLPAVNAAAAAAAVAGPVPGCGLPPAEASVFVSLCSATAADAAAGADGGGTAAPRSAVLEPASAPTAREQQPGGGDMVELPGATASGAATAAAG